MPRSAPMADPALEHRDQIDGLRFVSFLGVFVFHCNETAFWFGSYGVSLFYVISGFLITRILLAEDGAPRGRLLRAFYARRFLRIVPPYYLVLLVGLPIIGIRNGLAHVLFITNWAGFAFSLRKSIVPDETRTMLLQMAPGAHFWSLCVEEQFYVLFPLFFLALPVTARLWGLGAVWIAAISWRVWFAAFLPRSFYGLLPMVCGEYLIVGCLGACLLARGDAVGRRLREAARAWMLPVGVLLAAGVFLMGPSDAALAAHVVMPPHTQTLLVLAFAFVVLGLWEAPPGRVRAAFQLAPVRYLGRISYGLYLIHGLMWPLTDRWLGGAIGPWEHAMLRAALTVMLAVTMWHAFERPVLSLKTRFAYTTTGRPLRDRATR